MIYTHRKNNAGFYFIAILSLLTICVYIGCGGGGGGGNDGAGDDSSINTIQGSEIADVWRVYFYQNGEAYEDSSDYLYFSLLDNELICLSLYEGAIVQTPVTIIEKDIYFNYLEGEKDWDLSATVDGGAMTGTWNDNYSVLSGTWNADKMLQSEILEPVFYNAGDVLMDLTLQNGVATATLYGTSPQDAEIPVFTGYVITTEEGEVEIVLNDKEQVTNASFGDITLDFTYNSDGTFNYELYSDGLLTYSASNLPYSASANTLIQSNIYGASNDYQNLQIQKNSGRVEISSVNSIFKEELIGIKAFLTGTRISNLYHDLDDQNLKMKSGFYGYAVQNKEFNDALNKLSIISLLSVYHQKNIEKECYNADDPQKCKDYCEKVNTLWTNYLKVLSESLNNLIVQLHDQYEAPLCSDSDNDKFNSHENCGTKVDCNDIDSSVYPGNKEICDDEKDNDCNGLSDCDDIACINDPSCAQKSKVWKLVETSILSGGYESTREETCLGEGSDGEIITLSGSSIDAHWYSFSKYCGNHFDVTGTITFDTPPETVDPGTTVTLNTSGTQSGYQDCCTLVLWFNYYTDAGSIEVAPPGYLQLDLRDLPITQVYYPDDGSTRDGWQGTVTHQAQTTFTFPEAYVNDFWCSGRGNRGVGYAWHYQIQE